MPRTTRSATRPTQKRQDAFRDAHLQLIAKEILGLETLETRNSDSLDFREHAVWTLKAALEAAYEAGRKAV